MVSHIGFAMGPLDRAVTTSYRLSIVTMCPFAAVWPQFSVIGSRTLGFGRRQCGQFHSSDSWDSCCLVKIFCACLFHFVPSYRHYYCFHAVHAYNVVSTISPVCMCRLTANVCQLDAS